MGEFPFSFALQCAIAVKAEAEAEAEEEAMRRREGLGSATGGSFFSSSRRRCSDGRDWGVEVGVREFRFSVADQGAIDRGRGAGGAGGPPPGQWT
jgi:hypothetical protein